MDQKKFSGVGNYILSEIFYRAKLNPFLNCNDLSDDQWRVLYDQIVVVVGTHLRATPLIYLLTHSLLTHSLTHSLAFVLIEHSFASQLPSLQNKKLLSEKYNNQEFNFYVYSRSFCANGYKVIREEGPHKRTIHYVQELQGKIKEP